MDSFILVYNDYMLRKISKDFECILNNDIIHGEVFSQFCSCIATNYSLTVVGLHGS